MRTIGILLSSWIAGAAGAAETSFTRGPFVQNATDHSIQVIWRTAVAAGGSVEYGPSPSLGSTAQSGEVQEHQVVTLEGLAPGTTYYYQVWVDTGGVSFPSSPASFRTLTTSGPVSFVAIGDTRVAGIGPNQPQPLLALHMREATPDLVVHLGDIVTSGFNDFTVGQEFFRFFQEQMQSVPFYLIAGNHDISPGLGGDLGGTNFQNAFYLPTNSVDGSELYYSFDHGDAHFVCLFNPWFYDYVFDETTAQYQWLTNDLAHSAKPWKLLFTHHPIGHSGAHALRDYGGRPGPDQYDLMQMIAPVAERYGVQLVLGSHDHNFERFAPTNGLHHAVSGGGGAGLYNFNYRHPGSAQFWPVYQFLKVAITNDTLSLQAVDTNGLVFDSLTIQKALPPRQIYSAQRHTPLVEDQPASDSDGNVTGQSFDFIGTPICPRAGRFSNLGQLFVNYDSTHLYLGLRQVMIYPINNLFLFLEAPGLPGVTNLTGLGNGLTDPDEQGVDGLDFLENLSFTNFAPGIACILGDEYGDGQFRSFARSPIELNTGQGVFRLDTPLSTVPGVRLQQYNRSPQNYLTSIYQIGVTVEQNADCIEIAIPLSELGSLAPGGQIRLGAVVGSGAFDDYAQTQELDTSVLGYALHEPDAERQVLEGVVVQLDGDILVSIAPAGPGQYRLSWNAVVGGEYQIEFSTALPRFAPLADPRLPWTATSAQESLLVEAPAGQSGFFRVRQEP